MRKMLLSTFIVILVFLLVGCRDHPDNTPILNRDNKVIGMAENLPYRDLFTSYESNPVDIEYVFKFMQTFYPEIPDSLKSKINNGETGVWVFDKIQITVSQDKSKQTLLSLKDTRIK